MGNSCVCSGPLPDKYSEAPKAVPRDGNSSDSSDGEEECHQARVSINDRPTIATDQPPSYTRQSATLSPSQRLGTLLATLFDPEEGSDGTPRTGPKPGVLVPLLPRLPSSPVGSHSFRVSTETSIVSGRVSVSRMPSQRMRKSVVAYQHILDGVRAGLQPARDEPPDPRWKSLLPFQPRCLRHQVLSVNKDCTQVEGAIAFVDISGFSALANAMAN
eukprot:RCo005233